MTPEENLKNILGRFFGEPELNTACMSLLDFYKIDYAPVSPSELYLEDFVGDEFVAKHRDFVRKIDAVTWVGVASQDTFLNRVSDPLTAEALEKKLENDHYNALLFLCVDTNDKMTRTEIAMLTRAFNRASRCRPVVLFVRYGNLLSLTTCERMDYVQSGHVGEKVGKVTILRDINCSAPHRGHLNILSSLDISKCNSFDEIYDKWLETFSNELLTKKFYNELSDWYAWAVQVVRFPNDIDDDTDDAKYNTESTIRMVTRLIFVWFLKEKRLIPEEFFDVSYIQNNLLDGFNPYNTNDNLFGKSIESRYYKAILQNLFFAMLNCPIVNEGSTDPDARRFSKQNSNDHGNNKLLRYSDFFKNPELFIKLANEKVPFLNGGLFDCLDDKDTRMYYDGFSDNERVRNHLIVPDYLFFGEEVGKAIDLSEYYGDKNKKKVSARGIIDILKRYNFTIEENTPLEQEVSLDPELLGKVFENLLASYNPETKTTARKATGSFYTPREIVQYMVDESLVAHLKSKVSLELEPTFRELLSYSSGEVEVSDELRKKIMTAIYNCKVLDPACGSGAFPVGMLQQMVHVLSRIDPSNEAWKELMIEQALRESKNAFETESKEERQQKQQDIEEAFDESLNYPDYARKLYLIENCIYGVDIQPIAIQISHLRFFISLIVDQKVNDDPMKNFGVRPLPNLEAKFVAANSLIPLDRNDNLFSSISEVKMVEKQLRDANHKIFSAKTPKTKRKWREESKRLRQEMADTLVHVGAINNASQIASWDMFDQNASAGFFDPEWMFGVESGFDIVIGNPPYCQISKKLYSSKTFPYSEGKDTGKQNLYKLFTEFGYNVAKENGVSCMIVQSSLMCDVSASHTRELLLKHTCIEKVIEFPKTAPTKKGQVFKTVCQGTCIFLFKKKEPYSQKFMLSVNNDCTTIHRLEEEYISQKDLISFYPEDFAIPLLHRGEFPILKRIKENTKLKAFIYSALQGDLNLTNDKDYFSSVCTSVSLLRGKHVSNYQINYDVDEYVAEDFKPNLVSDNKKYKYLVCQQITGLVDYRRIHCAITDTNRTFLFGNSVNKMRVKDDSKGNFILALLNSKLIDWVFRKTSSNNHVNCYELEQLPIKDINNTKVYDKLVHVLETYPYGEALYAPEALKLDFLIYHHYCLTYDEVRIIDPETPITREEYENFKLD